MTDEDLLKVYENVLVHTLEEALRAVYDAGRADGARAQRDMEPTDAMGNAIYVAWDSFGEDAVMGPHEAIAIYRAIQRAAPLASEDGTDNRSAEK